jgi:hypothetical protein
VGFWRSIIDIDQKSVIIPVVRDDFLDNEPVNMLFYQNKG